MHKIQRLNNTVVSFYVIGQFLYDQHNNSMTCGYGFISPELDVVDVRKGDPIIISDNTIAELYGMLLVLNFIEAQRDKLLKGRTTVFIFMVSDYVDELVNRRHQQYVEDGIVYKNKKLTDRVYEKYKHLSSIYALKVKQQPSHKVDEDPFNVYMTMVDEMVNSAK